MPRRLARLGVRMMLLRPSRTGRTSTTPPYDKPEALRHHLGSVPWPTLVTIIVSSSFTAQGFIKPSLRQRSANSAKDIPNGRTIEAYVENVFEPLMNADSR